MESQALGSIPFRPAAEAETAFRQSTGITTPVWILGTADTRYGSAGSWVGGNRWRRRGVDAPGAEA